MTHKYGYVAYTFCVPRVHHDTECASYHFVEVFKQMAQPCRDNVPPRMPEVWWPLVLESGPSAARQASRIYTLSLTSDINVEIPDIPDKKFAYAGATQQWRIEVQV